MYKKSQNVNKTLFTTGIKCKQKSKISNFDLKTLWGTTEDLKSLWQKFGL